MLNMFKNLSTFEGIVSDLTKITDRLDAYIAAKTAEREANHNAISALEAQITERVFLDEALDADISQADRVRAKVADLVA